MRRVFAVVLVFLFSINVAFANQSEQPSYWAKDEIQKGISNSILNLDLNSNYHTNITRDDFCKLTVSMYIKENNFVGVNNLLSEKFYINLNQYKSAFKDIEPEDLNYEYVVAANLLGFVNGVEADKFNPKAEITREQAAKMLLLVYEKMISEKVGNQESIIDYFKFSDHDEISDWAKDYVYSARALGIMNGVSNNTFDSKGKYTREQALVTAVRLYDVYLKNSGNEVKETINQVEKNFQDTKDNKPKTENIEDIKEEVLRLSNQEREKQGLAPLKEGLEYNYYADIRAKEISSLFAHKRLDGSSIFDEIKGFTYAGENIAVGQINPEDVLNSWMNSSGHRANILNPKFEYMSVGVFYDDTNSRNNWVQIFYSLNEL